MSVDCVVDASVAIKLFLVEPLSERADALFEHLTAHPSARFYVPDHFFIECANILWKYVRHYSYTEQAACQDLADLVQLPLHVISTSDLAQGALALGIAVDITAYDAAYAVLSERLALPLVTADQPLVKHLKDTAYDVRFLAEWP